MSDNLVFDDSYVVILHVHGHELPKAYMSEALIDAHGKYVIFEPEGEFYPRVGMASFVEDSIKKDYNGQEKFDIDFFNPFHVMERVYDLDSISKNHTEESDLYALAYLCNKTARTPNFYSKQVDNNFIQLLIDKTGKFLKNFNNISFEDTARMITMQIDAQVDYYLTHVAPHFEVR